MPRIEVKENKGTLQSNRLARWLEDGLENKCHTEMT